MAVSETKVSTLTSMLPTMPVPVEAIQSTEVSSPSSAANFTTNIVLGSNPCVVPIATLSIRELRLRGSSFIRSHASKHGLPNASRKLMKEVIELLKTHYAVVHHQHMLEDDFSDTGSGGGGKMTNKKKHSSPAKAILQNGGHHAKSISPPSLLPQRPVSLVPLQMQMSNEHLLSQVASIVERLPVDRRLQAIQEPVPPIVVSGGPYTNGTDPTTDPLDFPCSARILARTRGELTSFGTSLLRPEAAAHKVHNSSRKPKHVVIEELWRHYVQRHSHELMANQTDDTGCIGNVIDDEDDK